MRVARAAPCQDADSRAYHNSAREGSASAAVVLIRSKAIRILPIVTHRVGVTTYALIYISR